MEWCCKVVSPESWDYDVRKAAEALDKNRLASGRVIGETSLRSLGAGQPSAPAL